MKKKGKWGSASLTTMMANEADPETQAAIALCYKTFPKKAADGILEHARAAAAHQKLAKTTRR